MVPAQQSSQHIIISAAEHKLSSNPHIGIIPTVCDLVGPGLGGFGTKSSGQGSTIELLN